MPSALPFRHLSKKPALIGWLVFFVLVIAASLLTYQRFSIIKESKARELTNAALNAKDRLTTALDQSKSAVRTLGFILSRYESRNDFDSIAKRLLDSNLYVDALELVDEGIITHVYPLEENKAAIGYDILNDSLVNKEARRAIVENKLFYAGPILLKQGYVGVIGRLPLFSEGKFRGFAAAIVKLSTLIEAAEFADSSNKDYLFQLSKIDPNTGKEQFFLPLKEEFKKEDWVSVNVEDGDWKIYARYMHANPELGIIPFIILAFLFAISGGFFAWYGARQPYRLKQQVEEKTRQLKASEEKYYSYFEKASDTIVVTDIEGYILEVNNSVCKLLGYSRDELIGKHFTKFIEPAQLATDPMDLNFHHRQEELIRERRLVKKDGGIVEIEINVKKIDGNRHLSIGRDITGIREAQKKIAISESTLRGAFEHSAMGMALVGIDGKWIRVNRALCNMLGYTRHEMLSMSFKDITHPDDKEGGIQFLNDAVKTGADSYQAEKRYITKIGELLWVSVNVSAVRDDNGHILYFVTQTEDITGKKKITELLQAKEEQLRLFIEHSPAALAMVDKNMRYLSTSKRWLTDYGLEGKQIIGKSHYEIFPNIPQHWYDIHRRCLQGETEKCDEDRFVDQNGKMIWLRWEIHPWRQYTGAIGGIIMFTEIITKLKEAEMKFRNLVEQSLVGVCIVQDEKFAYVNPRFAEIYGYTTTEMINTFPANSLIAEEYRHFFTDKNIADAVEQIKSINYEAIGKRKDGTLIYLEAYGTVTTYEGRPAIIRTVLDITKRKKAEENLKESEEKFRNLVEKSLAGVYILQDGKVIYINPAHEKILGYSLEELQQMDSVEPLVYESDIPIFRAYHYVDEDGDRSQSQYGLRAIRKDGKLIYLEMTTSRILYEGRPALIGTTLDITDRIEEEIRVGRAVNEAQEKERMQIGMELHDNVKQIMAAVLLTADFVKAHLADIKMASDHVDAIRNYTKEAIAELRRLSHQLAPAINKTDSFKDQVEKLVATLDKDHKLEIAVQIPSEEDNLSEAISTAFYRILQEQFNNIFKYAKATSVLISIKYNDKDCVMIIRDNGVGFDPSVRSEGIGLENIRRRAFVLGGTAKIISSPGNGCEVRITIPISK